MTQQYMPYAPPQGYEQPAPAYGYPPQAPQYPTPNPQGYGPQQFVQPNPYQAPGQAPYGVQTQGYPQQPPAPVGAKGSLEDYYSQPSTGGGKGISFKQKPDGYTYALVVSKTPTDGDLFQDSDPQTKQLKTWRDGRPKLVLPVQCRIAPLDAWQAQEYNEGDASFYLRGGLRDEVTRAMSEAGQEGVPQQGALVFITLTHRKPGNNIATNVYAVQYHPAGTWETNPQFAQFAHLSGPRPAAPAPQQAPAPQYAGAPQQAPYPQPAPAQYAAPQQAAPTPQQYAPQQVQPQAYDPNQAPQAQQYAPVVSTASGQPVTHQQAVPTPQQVYNGATGSAEYGAPAQAVPTPQQYAQPDSQPTVAAPAQQAYAPQQPPAAPVQPGVQGSALTPEKQALLSRIASQKQAPVQQPQG